jgi:hypothetical protein
MSLIRSFNTRRQVIGVLCAAMLIFPSTGVVLAQQPGSGLTVPIVGTIPGVPGGSFVGSFTLQRFAVVDGAVAAVGRLTGTLTGPGGVTTTILQTLRLPIPIGNVQATCDILHLELGPLDLNLLGLVVHLNQIVLDIDAQSGPGNLLGNLLCSVAGLLDNPGGLATLLNRILALLG